MSFAQVEPLSTPANIEKARTMQKCIDKFDESKKKLEAITSLKLNLDIELSRKELEIDALKNSQELLKREHEKELNRLGYERSILEHEIATRKEEINKLKKQRDIKEKNLENKMNSLKGQIERLKNGWTADKKIRDARIKELEKKMREEVEAKAAEIAKLETELKTREALKSVDQNKDSALNKRVDILEKTLSDITNFGTMQPSTATSDTATSETSS